jgi:hypothetical protein
LRFEDDELLESSETLPLLLATRITDKSTAAPCSLHQKHPHAHDHFTRY